MRNEPISPQRHGLIDYGISTWNLLAPRLLGLNGRARAVFGLFGAIQGGLNAVTQQPYAVKRIVPFRTHGTTELATGPAFVALPWLTGALEDGRARAYYGTTLAVLVTNYLLTDWDARTDTDTNP